MSGHSEDLKQFLDANQYSRKSILRYEKIFGVTYVSTGGEVTTAEFCSEMSLKPGMKILDVGAGIGGSAFYMAKTFGVEIDGVDLSSNMVDIANENRGKMDKDIQKKVNFKVEDATKMDYPENYYDVVYSRDTILHIADKKSLFINFFKTLKPNGCIVITDYCKGDLSKLGKEDYSQDFKDYVADRGYHLLTVEQYGQVLTDAGFLNVDAQDRTKQFVNILHRELANFRKIRDEVVNEYSLEDFDHICQGWEEKVVRCGHGDQGPIILNIFWCNFYLFLIYFQLSMIPFANINIYF